MQQCFVIFQGGGAKGITHLGALKALEEAGLQSVGVAGTSAGAIVAALSAVGYKADEIFKPDGSSNILRPRTPLDLLGEADWLLFAKVYGNKRSDAARRVADPLRKAFLFSMTLVAPLWPLLVFRLARVTRQPKLLGGAWRVIEGFGFFSTCQARDILNELLRNRLSAADGSEPPELICFRDLDPVTRTYCSPLKIIATDLQTGRLKLFDNTTPNVVVADAVAASFAIPLFFQPAFVRELDDTRVPKASDVPYADGGLVSNLPIWAFAEDKRMIERLSAYRNNKPIPIVAFTLTEVAPKTSQEPVPSAGALHPQVDVVPTNPPKPPGPLSKLGGHMFKVLNAGIFGGQQVVAGFIPHLTVVELPSPLKVASFDCNATDALAAYTSGRDEGLAQLRRALRINPYARQVGMKALLDKIESSSRDIRTAENATLVIQFRVCLIRQLGNQSFKVIDSYNMEKDNDDDLILDRRNPGAPTAFHDRDLTYVDRTDEKTDFFMTKYEKALLRPTLASLISVPIFDTATKWGLAASERGDPVGVFCIDSDSSLRLEYDSPGFRDMLKSETIKFAAVMQFIGETS